MKAEVVAGIAKIRARSGTALTPDDSPFVDWDWLSAMEQSDGDAQDRMGAASYRGPRPKRLVAACPVYLKSHSMGEFVFDHGWADAAERAGLRYFPKLLVGVPFTPHTGRRVLPPRTIDSR